MAIASCDSVHCSRFNGLIWARVWLKLVLHGDEILIHHACNATGQLNSPRAGNGAGDAKSQEVGVEDDTMSEVVKLTLLHGTLEVWLLEAKNLPNMDVVSERFRQCFSYFSVCKAPFTKAKTKLEDKAHGHRPKGITSDPYAAVNLAGARVARTRVIQNDTSPKWNEHFSIPVAHYVRDVQITIKDDDMLGAQLIGNVTIPVEQVLDGQVVEGWYDVLASSGKIVHPGAQLHFKMVFHTAAKNPLYMQGVGDGRDFYGVPNTYFPCRKGCRLTLYQDAHVMDGSLPEITLENGVKFHHRRAWEELCTAILEAHHLVYITGWSIYTKIKLLRDTTRPIPDGGDLTLGELLKRKSAEGVRVLMLVWDDKTSHSNAFIKTVSPHPIVHHSIMSH